MFDYRFARNGQEYTARLRQEALNDRLARSVNPGLTALAARAFRAWATRLERRSSQAAPTWWSLEEERHALDRSRRHAYAGTEL